MVLSYFLVYLFSFIMPRITDYYNPRQTFFQKLKIVPQNRQYIFHRIESKNKNPKKPFF